MATASKSQPAPTVVYLIPIADAVPAKSFANEAEALEFEDQFNQRERRQPEGKYIAVADVEHVISIKRGTTRRVIGGGR